MNNESKHRSSRVFSASDINAICARLQIRTDTSTVIEVMRNECFLILKGPNLYQLNTL